MLKHLTQMRKLVINELYKTFFQKKTMVFIAFLLFCIFICAIGNYSNDRKTEDWREETKEQIASLKDSIKETKKSLDDAIADDPKGMDAEIEQSVLDFQNDELAVLEYRIDKDIPENVITPLKFVYKCKGFIALIVFFMAVFSANIIANEYSWGTIRQVLIKPVNRWKIYISKMLSAFIVTAILCLLLYIVSLIVGFALFSKNSTSIYEVSIVSGKIYKVNMFSNIILGTLADIFTIMVLCSISFFVGTLIRNNILAIFLTIGTYFIGFIAEGFLTNTEIYKFLLSTNLSLDDYLPGGTLPFAGATFIFSFIVCLVYFVVLLLGGMSIFCKRDVY